MGMVGRKSSSTILLYTEELRAMGFLSSYSSYGSVLENTSHIVIPRA